MKRNPMRIISLIIITFAAGILVSIFLPDILLVVLLCITLILLSILLLR